MELLVRATELRVARRALRSQEVPRCPCFRSACVYALCRYDQRQTMEEKKIEKASGVKMYVVACG